MKTIVQPQAQTGAPRKCRSLSGGGRNLYRIEAGEGWDVKKWGNPPYFGKVRADNEYWAEYEAYDRLKVSRNDTFKLKIIQLPLTSNY